MKTIAWALAALLSASGLAQAQDVQAGFRAFLQNDVWPEAKAAGVSRATFDTAFRDVKANTKLPDLQLPGDKAKVEETNRQAEFQSPTAYFDEAKMAATAARGRAMLRQHAGTIKRIEERYGVPGPIVVAVWGGNRAMARPRSPTTPSRCSAPRPISRAARRCSAPS